MKAKHNLEHRIFASWKKKNHGNIHQRVMVAVSGGRDSMVLLHAMLNCFSNKNIVVIHVHHGPGENQKFRDQAQKLVADFCVNHSITFECATSETHLDSEAEFREFRLQQFSRFAVKHKIQIVALAHHRDDWLENQLIKLIRGSSFSALRKGFSWSSMKEYKLLLWRPLIDLGKDELDVYRQEKKLDFVEDPSNQDSRYFRNWLRNQWLPQLDQIRPGAVKALAQSLIHSIADMAPSQALFPWNFKTSSIDFIYFLSLSDSEKLRCLAFFIHHNGIKSIRANQLKELIRQLDKNSVHYHIRFKTFECLVNAEQLIIKDRV